MTHHLHHEGGFRPPFPFAFAASSHSHGLGGGFRPSAGFGASFGAFGGRSRARRGDVRLAVLSLLADNPSNGYGLIKAIAEKTDDAWRVSPGSVYPTLSQLVDESLIMSESGTYRLTEAGQEYVAGHADELAAVWEDMGAQPEDEAELKTAAMKLFGAIRQFGMEAAPDKQAEAAAKLDVLRKELYRLLGE